MFGKNKRQNQVQDNQQLAPEPVPHDSLGASDASQMAPAADDDNDTVLIHPDSNQGDGPPPLQQNEPPQPLSTLPKRDDNDESDEDMDEPPVSKPPAQEPVQTGQTTGADDTELLNIKQQALLALDPLVDKLDQTPEEKFRTTMMMIQATDNPGLIKSAYEAAQKITNEKTRAQALLDVVNEINYFTQHPQD